MIIKVNISQKPAEIAAEKLSSLLRESEPNSILLMLSGGSAFEILRYIVIEDFSRLTVSMLDERYSEDESVNNFALLAKTEFYKKALSAGASFIDTRPKANETMNDLEVHFDYALKNWIHDNPSGKIIATMGIGEDGHTAGIFAHGNDEKFRFIFEQDERYVIGYNTPKNEYHERITVTNHFLREYVDSAVVFTAEEKKRGALEKTLAPDGNLFETPARIIREMKEVELFTDVEIDVVR